MTKQEQIEEMAVLGCLRTPQAHTAEECSKCDFKQGMCPSHRHAEALYNAGYRKGEAISYQAIIDSSLLDRINELENRLIEVRKETAKEILQAFKNSFIFFDKKNAMSIDLVITRLENICKKYGVGGGRMKIDELLIDFDEMGFAPTTLCENPDEYACEWKKQLVAEIERLETHPSKTLRKS